MSTHTVLRSVDIVISGLLIEAITTRVSKLNVDYRTLCGRDQRKRFTLNFTKYTLSQPTVFHDHKECFIAPQRVLYSFNKALFAVQ